MNRNLKKYKRNLDKEGKIKEAQEYNFFPIAYHLPLEYALLVEEFKKAALDNKNAAWIMKPTSKSQGKGIFIFNKLTQIQEWAENPEVLLIFSVGRNIYLSEIHLESTIDWL